MIDRGENISRWRSITNICGRRCARIVRARLAENYLTDFRRGGEQNELSRSIEHRDFEFTPRPVLPLRDFRISFRRVGIPRANEERSSTLLGPRRRKRPTPPRPRYVAGTQTAALVPMQSRLRVYPLCTYKLLLVAICTWRVRVLSVLVTLSLPLRTPWQHGGTNARYHVLKLKPRRKRDAWPSSLFEPRLASLLSFVLLLFFFFFLLFFSRSFSRVLRFPSWQSRTARAKRRGNEGRKEGRRRGEEGKAKRDKKDATETGKRNGETKRV